MELYTMPPGMFNVLYAIAYEKMKSGESSKEAEADLLEEALEEGGLMPNG